MISNRRTMLGMTIAAGAALPGYLAARSGRTVAGPDTTALHGMTVVNALGSLFDPNQPGPQRNAFSPRVLADAHASGVTAINITLGYVSGPGEPFETSVRSVATFQDMLRSNQHQLAPVLTEHDIAAAKSSGRIGLIAGFQNAAMMGDDATRVDIFADMGVRIIQLTYNIANQLGGGSLVSGDVGLTPFGREVVGRLNQRRVMVDLSHSNERTCLDAIATSTAPVSINHTGCRALADLPRNKTDAELRKVAERGGFVGIYFMPFLKLSGHPDATDVVEHIDHAVNVCGEDHVGIGTDGPITAVDDLEAFKVEAAKDIAARRALGVGAAGEGADTLPFVVDLRGVDQFRKLVGLLKARGYGQRRIEKVMGENFCRYARDVWGS